MRYQYKLSYVTRWIGIAYNRNVSFGLVMKGANQLTYARLPISREQAVVVVAIQTLAVVPPGQVDTDGFVITLHETMKTLIDVCQRGGGWGGVRERESSED